jgi:hypothetical protein
MKCLMTDEMLIETSIGALRFYFAADAPGRPPSINVCDPAMKQLWATFEFAKHGWIAEHIEFFNAKVQGSSALMSELVRHVADWALRNQERFIQHQRDALDEELRATADIFDRFLTEISDAKNAIRSRAERIVEPYALAKAYQVQAAIAEMQRVIVEARSSLSIAGEADHVAA